MKTRVSVWSCGGGVQSSAIAALICQGLLPNPELALIADTGMEQQSTWDYLSNVVNPALLAAGKTTVERIFKPPGAQGLVWNPEGEDVEGMDPEDINILMPVHWKNTDGTTSRSRTFCSGEWKRKSVHHHLGTLGIGHRSHIVEMWLGMSRDELRRVRVSNTQWIEHHYPLVMGYGLSYRRSDCMTLVERMGWPPAPRSSCWGCPNHSDAEWATVKQNPGEWAQALALQDHLLQISGGRAYLHRGGDLRDIDLQPNSQQLGLFDQGCASGMCFV